MQKRKIILLSALILSGIQIFSQEKYKMDEILEMIKSKSKTNLYYESEKEQNELKKQEAEGRNRNGITTSISTYRSKEKEKYGDLQFTENTKYINLTNKYNIFTSEVQYDIEKEKLESNKIGVEKNLVEYIYSERKKDLKVNKMERKISDLERRIDIKDELAVNLEKLREYISIEKEIELREIQYSNLKEENELIKKAVEVGERATADVDYSILQSEIVKSEIETLKIRKKKYLELLEEKTGKNISIKNLEIPEENEINSIEISLDEIGIEELMLYEYQEGVLEEEKKLSDFNNKIPSIQVYGNRDFESKDYEIGLSFSKVLFNRDYVTKSIELDKKKLDSKKIKHMEDIKIRRKEAENYFSVLKRKYYGLSKEMEYYSKESRRYEKLYEIKEVSYAEYIEKKNNYIDKEVELYTVLYEMYILSEKLKIGRV